jgi:hypothetical protein
LAITQKMLVPVLRNAEHIWDKVLNQLALPRHAADIPHPQWMDLWVSGQTLPQAAFLPVTPSQRQARQPSREFFNWGRLDSNVMPPLFMDIPQGVTTPKSFEEVANVYYSVLLEHYEVGNLRARDWDGKHLFSAIPPRDAAHAQAIFTALNKALPDAHWIIFATTQALPEAFPWDLPRERITVVTSTPPTIGVNWLYAPPPGTDLQTIVAHCQDSTQCKGWLNAADTTMRTLDNYWEHCVILLNNHTHTYPIEEALCKNLTQMSHVSQSHTKATSALLTDDAHTLYAHAAIWLRQQDQTEITAAWLKRIEEILAYDLQIRAYHAFTHSEDYTQWHLRTFGSLPNWHALTTPDTTRCLTQEAWRQFLLDVKLKGFPAE